MVQLTAAMRDQVRQPFVRFDLRHPYIECLQTLCTQRERFMQHCIEYRCSSVFIKGVLIACCPMPRHNIGYSDFRDIPGINFRTLTKICVWVWSCKGYIALSIVNPAAWP